MANKMLIDATHPEETRVVVLRGNRVEEFDFESANRKQLRGNIYLAKVTRVEPSLQAAFVDYGGNRHGFLAFGEIHPDYYQIPVADRQALIDEEERVARAAELEADNRAGRRHQREHRAARARDETRSAPIEEPDEVAAMAAGSEIMTPAADATADVASRAEHEPEEAGTQESTAGSDLPDSPLALEAAEPPGDAELPSESIALDQAAAGAEGEPLPESDEEPGPEPGETPGSGDLSAVPAPIETGSGGNIIEVNGGSGEEDAVESVGGADAMEEVPERAPRMRRQYKIQEVIKRRQIMLVQVVKEERGTKGAALTTYLSLAGRYSVLMPNTARGGGISRKITDALDRRRLKEVALELEVPEGMGVILRTAGASRTKTEIKRDFEYLLRLWETVRDLTLKSTAPTLVYEEGSLVKRSIRDLYNKDIDEILVAGSDAYREARDFMRMLMPSHTRNVKPYQDGLPIFSRFGIESQLDAMFQPVVQLRSGGYIVLNQAEALVAIDVNSGRATREHHIEDTALKTNLEAAEEIARQLRLRDLAGLIVIDFIDMDEKRNNRTVERRLKEALKHDRARIQVGHISHFGLLEMSRQRIRSSVLESSTENCPQCGGTGHVRSVSSVSLQLLRAIEEMLLKAATHSLIVRTRTEIALYLLNHKRAHLRELEERFQLSITVDADATVVGQLSYVIEKGEQVHSPEQAKALAAQSLATIPAVAEEEDEPVGETEEELEEAGELAAASATPIEGERNGRRRRRRRRGRGGEGREEDARPSESLAESESDPTLAEAGVEPEMSAGAGPDGDFNGVELQGEAEAQAQGDGDKRRRRRGRRGGRRNRHGRDGEAFPQATEPTTAAREGEPEAEPAPASFESETTFEPPSGEAPSPPEPNAAELAPEPIAAPPPQPAPELAQEPASEPVHETVAEPVAAAASPPERPARRGSTVREPAPGYFGGHPSAPTSDVHVESELPAQSAPTETEPAEAEPAEAEDSARPRRSGWWSRRVLGKG
jgi:ribonuclease E